ncbi:excalibur calcium-binding domain-containing protein [Miltoncostaea oceani]|uniref:excalibur calcium-binding domain-containing protein n=1 Tax=Miltoncostaea oceani TaxID=2843216 RepID=UPI001C3E58AE|nr:excalibur calcium-binding domain-containing protein [Miltoncostaea oceani]
MLLAGFGFNYVPDAPSTGFDLNCADIGHRVNVTPGDPHGLDRDGDGVGCETDGHKYSWLGILGLCGAGAGGFVLYRNRRDSA